MSDDQPPLFELPPPTPGAPATITPITVPLWTRNKARLVREYLLLFVQVTHHGTYIDGFAGPQAAGQPAAWTAELVLEVQQVRHFHFFETDSEGIVALEALRARQPPVTDRSIEIWPGDFNVRVHELLASGAIGPREATFCLLDQRTFECHWATLDALASQKPAGHYKIELFYFLAQKWMDRALDAQRDPGPPRAWWGREDWRGLLGLSRRARAQAFVDRFRNELGYQHVMAWPILEREGAGAPVMYFMIHASDHPAAAGFMRRAYDSAVLSAGEQLRLI